VVLLAGGAIIEEGPAGEVLTNPRNPVAQRFLNAMEAEVS
jgi:polar amino acid transport system permease protein